MKKFITISSACALAFAGLTHGQESSVPATAPTPAKQASAEAQKLTAEMLNCMQERMDIIASVKDKATADAAAPKLTALNAKEKAVLEKLGKLSEDDQQLAMQPNSDKLSAIIMTGIFALKSVEDNEYYGSAALKAVLESLRPKESNGGSVTPPSHS